MEGIEDLPRESGNLSETCHSGMMSEMIFATEAAKQGFGVFFPVGHSQKADLVVWKPPARPVTVQVKKATWQKGGAFKFMVGSGKPSCAANPNDYGKRYTPYQKGDFDVLCAHIAEHDTFAFYNLEDLAGKSSHRWRAGIGQRENNWDIFKRKQ